MLKKYRIIEVIESRLDEVCGRDQIFGAEGINFFTPKKSDDLRQRDRTWTKLWKAKHRRSNLRKRGISQVNNRVVGSLLTILFYLEKT